MSRSQQGQVLNQATGQNATYNSNAQTSYNTAQTDEGNYEDQLAKYSANNPYVQGGQDQTLTNQQMSNTADAGSQAAGEALQSAAVRTGQNPGGAIAATEAISEDNARNLENNESQATQNRIGAGAQYGTDVLAAEEQPATFESQLAGQQGGLAQGTLNTEEQAAATPSFEDELGQGLINAGVSFAGGFGQAAGKAAMGGCWIAAELYGGWDDPRTIAVRAWIFGPFAERWYGRLLGDLYVLYGERLAKTIQTNPWLRRKMAWLFNCALRASEKAGN